MSNRELPGLKAISTPNDPDVICLLGEFPPGIDSSSVQDERPFYTSPFRDANGVPILQIRRLSQSQSYCFEYCEGLTVLVDPGGREVWAQWGNGLSLDDVTAFLLHQVFGLILHLRGYVCLHASAVVVDGRAVLFAGRSGSGKSSTAGAFAQRGFRLLTDDISVVKCVDGVGLTVIPSVPRLCLWPDSTDFLYGEGAGKNFPKVQPGEEKRLIRLEDSGKYSERPAPLGALYLLASRSAEASAPRIDPLEDSEGLLQLLTNGYVSGVLESGQRAHEFQVQAEIIRSVPVQRLVPSSDPEKLAELCDLVLNDVRSASLI